MGDSCAGLSPRLSGVRDVLVRSAAGEADCRAASEDLSGEAEERLSNKSKFLLTPPALVLAPEAVAEGEGDSQVPLAAVFGFTSRERRAVAVVVVAAAVVVGVGVAEMLERGGVV